MRLVKDDKLFGTLAISMAKDGDTIRLVDFGQIASHYAPGQMSWDLGRQPPEGNEPEHERFATCQRHRDGFEN